MQGETQEKEGVEAPPTEEHKPDPILKQGQEVKEIHKDEKVQGEEDISHLQEATGVGMNMVGMEMT